MEPKETHTQEYDREKLRLCPRCNELYSVTYKTCPFCEEDRAMERGRPLRRRASDFRNKKGGHALSIMAMLLVLVLLGTGGVYFFGDSLKELLGMHDTSDIVANTEDTKEDKEPMVLAADALTLGLDETATLYVMSGSGSYVYQSANEEIATVNADGVIIPMAVGETTISVTDGYHTKECAVTVTDGVSMPGGETGENTETTEPPSTTDTTDPEDSSTGTTTSFTLNREDFTIKVGEKFRLKVSGSNATPIWSVDDSTIASVTGDGTVTGVGSGVTKVYATINGVSVPCIVRVP